MDPLHLFQNLHFSRTLIGTSYYHPSRLGTVDVVTDQLGHEASRYVYLPYGEVDVADSNLGYAASKDYTEQARDPESGLMYYHARYYDPSMGRFLTADSIIPNMRDAQSFNRYAYVRGNPVKYNDPTGHCFGFCGDGFTGLSFGNGNDDVGRQWRNSTSGTQKSWNSNWQDQAWVQSNWDRARSQIQGGWTHLLGSDISPNYKQANGGINGDQFNCNCNQDWSPNPTQFNNTSSTQILTAAIMCGLTCGALEAEWLQGNSNARHNMVDVLAIVVFIAIAAACAGPQGVACYVAAAGAAGYVRGYGHAFVEGKSGREQFNAGMIEGIKSAWLMAGAFAAVDAIPMLAAIGPGTAGGYAIGAAFTVGTDFEDAESRDKRSHSDDESE